MAEVDASRVEHVSNCSIGKVYGVGLVKTRARNWMKSSNVPHFQISVKFLLMDIMMRNSTHSINYDEK